MSRRLLGTMITYGYTGLCLDSELDLAQRLGAEVLEILPDWRALPDAGVVRQAVADRGLSIHSAHGCWGGRAIKASRVDLGETTVYRESADDLKRCIDWLQEAGGTFLVVHPGALSSV
ncbi:MAG: sugar phosphate isomerase/epimerase, partial [Isosphaeraceae bacterium]